jgi:cytochrome c biogenesis protein
MIIPISIKQIMWKFILKLSDLKLSIFLLLLISLASSLGTIIEQDKSPLFYELNYSKNNPILGFLTFELILFLGFDHVYSAPWFFMIIILFGGSLVSCTITRQLPSLKLSKLWHFLQKENHSKKRGLKLKLEEKSVQKLSYILRKENYNVVQRGPYMYAYKGLFGKVAPIFVHASMIIVLLGSVFSILTNSISQDMVPKGCLFRPQNIISAGPLSYMDQNFEGYLEDFKIAYTDQGTVDQFYSDLKIVDSNLNNKIGKTIFVNQPLKYKELIFYQTDWGIGSLRLKNSEKIEEIPLQKIFSDSNNNDSKFWIAPINTDKNLLLAPEDLTGNCPIYNKEGKFIGMRYVGSKIFLNGINTQIINLKPTSGLQTKSDKGIPTIYTGFLLLIPSSVLSYISYSQIWCIKRERHLHIHAETNRALYYFERFIIGIKYALKSE